MADAAEEVGSIYPGKSPYKMLPVDECVAAVTRNTGGALESVLLPLAEALGLVLAHDVAAQAPVPAFPASIMDGFALRSGDGRGRYPVDAVAGATAGGPSLGPLPDGHVRYITTGALVPEGADAVAKVEDTKEVWENGQLMIEINCTSKRGANIRQIGSDTAQGEVVLHRGTRIGAGEVGILAGLGLAWVEVHRRPRVALLSTGDELVDVGDAGSRDERRGQVVDCNRPMLHALLKEAGAEPVDFGIVRDEPGRLRDVLQSALASADVVVTSGGVSRGSKDHVKPLLVELGHVHFGEMCMKPGKPTTFATIPLPAVGEAGNSAVSASTPFAPRQRLVFALPGNPASCFVTFKLLVVPALEQLRGRPVGTPVYPRVDAELMQAVEMDPVRPEYHRAVARWQDGRIVAESTGFQRSSRVASCATANCLLELPARPGLMPKGTVVKALLLSGGSSGSGCGLSPEPCGYPAQTEASVVAAVVAVAVAPLSVAPTAEAASVKWKRPCRVGLLAVGPEGAAAKDEAIGCLCAVGVEGSSLVRTSVAADGEAVRGVIASWSNGSPCSAGSASAPTEMCDVILVLGRLGLSAGDAAVVTAVRTLLDREMPGLCDVVLRAGLPRSPLVMLAQLVAGLRNQTLVVTVPDIAPAESIRAVWPLLAHAVP